MSGGITAPKFSYLDDGGFFFRTCPSTRVTATALVERMLSDGMDTASFLFVPSDAGSALTDDGWIVVGPVEDIPDKRARIVAAPAGERLAVFRDGVAQPIVTQHARPDFRPYLHPIVAPDGRSVLTASGPASS